MGQLWSSAILLSGRQRPAEPDRPPLSEPQSKRATTKRPRESRSDGIATCAISTRVSGETFDSDLTVVSRRGAPSEQPFGDGSDAAWRIVTTASAAPPSSLLSERQVMENALNRHVKWLLAAPHQQTLPVGAVAFGRRVTSSYGCVFHTYPSPSVDSAHGSHLVWPLSMHMLAPLSVMGAVRLCRVANSCRKRVLLICETDGDDEIELFGVELAYAATI